MIKNLFPLVLFAIIAATSGCKKTEDPAFCSVKIELGEFAPVSELPYNDFQYKDIFNAVGDIKGFSVNHPQNLSFFKVKTTGIETNSSDCQSHASIEQYIWTTKYAQAFVSFIIESVNPPAVVIKETTILNETMAQPVAAGDYLEFYLQDKITGQIPNTPFMRLMTKALLPGKGQDLEFGYTFHNSMEIAGKTFNNIYVNSTALASPARKIFYSRVLGVIAIEDDQGEAWSINL